MYSGYVQVREEGEQMGKADICIRAFVNGNLGDDLFVDILCRRYPEYDFFLTGEKKFGERFCEIPNLNYISTDVFWRKWLIRMINLPVWSINKVIGGLGKKGYINMYRYFDHLSKKCQYNILISGSLFIEPGKSGDFVPGSYLKKDKRYYEREPYVMGCNFGPYHSEGYRQFYAECFAMVKQVSLRDQYSYQLFDGENIKYAPDIIFSYDRKRAQKPEETDYVLVSLLNLSKDGAVLDELIQGYEEAIFQLLQTLLKRDEKIVLLGFCKAQGDDKINTLMKERLGNSPNIKIVNYPEISIEEATGYFANAKSVVATRYHAMILGWLFEKPVLPLVYNEKMLHVIEDLYPDQRFAMIDQLCGDEDCLIGDYEHIMHSENNMELKKIKKMSECHFECLDQEFV